MDKQIETFKARYGKRIPDNILKLFFEDELYAYALNHKIGRELVSDAFFHTSDLIKKIALLSDEGELLLEQQSLNDSKLLLSRICEVVKGCKDSNRDLSMRNAFSKEEWEVFYNRCQTVERYDKERQLLDNGRQFYAAHKTIMSKNIESFADSLIDLGVREIWKGEVTIASLYYSQFCRAIKALWYKRLVDYGKNLIRIKKIIYKEN